MANITNGRCFADVAQNEPPLIQSGSLVLTAHDIGWIVTGCLTILAVGISFWLIDRHLFWYTNKREQRYIVRILLMVPIYAVITFASYLFWNHSIALLLIRDCYEAIVLTSFFYLILNYVSHDVNEQRNVFRKVGLSRENDRQALRRGERPRRWVFPLQFVQWKPEDGLYFLQLMKWGVLQYCVIRPTTTLAAVILNYIGLYCDDSWSPGWGHLYITVVMSVSVTVAIYCLLQLYLPIAEHIALHKPLLKLFAVKAVVFLTFWQETFISLLEDFNVIKDTTYMTADNVATGVSAILECFEMVLFALLHIRAYTYKPYVVPPGSERLFRFRALVHALNFYETFREIWASTVWTVRRARGQETDVRVRREAVLEDVFGVSRMKVDIQVPSEKNTKNSKRNDLVVEEVGGRGYPNDPTGALADPRRAGKEESLDAYSLTELGRRSYHRRDHAHHKPASTTYARVPGVDFDELSSPSHQPARVWWRDMYHRVSRSSSDENARSGPSTNTPSRRDPQKPDTAPYTEANYDDPPPPSAVRTYRSSRSNREQTSPPEHVSNSSLSQLSPIPAPTMQPLLRATPVPGLPTRSSQTSVRSMPPARFSLATTTTTSRDSDSFLHRAFTGIPESATSADTHSTMPPSSQSHRTRVRLTAEPAVISQSIPSARSSVTISAGDIPAPMVPSVASVSHIAQRPMTRYTPTGRRIVLPAPLAPPRT